MNRKLRVSWISNASHSPSGYGQQTADMGKMFKKSGWDGTNFSYIDMFGLQGGKIKDELGFIHYPLVNHAMGSDAMALHSRDFKSDIVISLLDIWPQNPQDLQQVSRWVPWVPIDYDPVPSPILSNLRLANRIIAMSRFGQKQLQDKGFASTYIPHHVDTDIFFPIDKKKRKIEQKIDPNTFIFGMVAANKDMMPRKSFQQVLDAFALFVKVHPNSLLYIHTNSMQPGGFPIKQYADFLGVGQRVGFPDLYKLQFDTPKEEMNKIYNTFDCFLNPSSTEGFGIPIIEAQATGTPVIVNDWTAMPELIIDGVTGFKTKIGCKHFFPIGSYLAWPDTQDLYNKMELVFSSNLVEMGLAARKNIMDNYSLDKVWSERWSPFLNNYEKEIYGEVVKETPSLTTPVGTV
jgi:glycosyltransferase involved in cell wall biosynthesis